MYCYCIEALFCFQPCVETVFVTLFHEFRDVLTHVLLKMIQDSSLLVDVNDLSGILRKDAIYSAVGLAAFDLYDEVSLTFVIINMLDN